MAITNAHIRELALFILFAVVMIFCYTGLEKVSQESLRLKEQHGPRGVVGQGGTIDGTSQVELEVVATLETEVGKIEFELLKDDAPLTVANFMKLVEQGFYSGCTFYRSEPGFVLQAGAMQTSGTTKPSPFGTIPLEYKVKNTLGTVAMARGNDLHSASTEFFINLRDNSEALGKKQSGGYAVFGIIKSDSTFKVLDQISALPITIVNGLNILEKPLVITKATVDTIRRGSKSIISNT